MRLIKTSHILSGIAKTVNIYSFMRTLDNKINSHSLKKGEANHGNKIIIN